MLSPRIAGLIWSRSGTELVQDLDRGPIHQVEVWPLAPPELTFTNDGYLAGTGFPRGVAAS